MWQNFTFGRFDHWESSNFLGTEWLEMRFDVIHWPSFVFNITDSFGMWTVFGANHNITSLTEHRSVLSNNTRNANFFSRNIIVTITSIIPFARDAVLHIPPGVF